MILLPIKLKNKQTIVVYNPKNIGENLFGQRISQLI